MTVKRAIEICDYLVKAHLKNSAGIRDLVKDWKTDTQGLAIKIAEVHEDVAECIFLIKKNLIPDCKHPKKMRDEAADGQVYCMNCNTDLDSIVIQ